VTRDRKKKGKEESKKGVNEKKQNRESRCSKSEK
jgi:hypothetical protein